MLTLCFEESRSASSLPRYGRALLRGAGLAAMLGMVACSDDGDGGGTVALADSGELFELTSEMGIPTTVAVADGVAWVVESQFDRYAPFMGVGEPAPFRLIGVQLDGSGYTEMALPPQSFPEGITATAGGRLFIGSVATGDIYTAQSGAATADVFTSELAPSTVGMTVGRDNATLWLCNTNTTTGTSAVIGIGIGDKARVGTHELPRSSADVGSFCNDLVMSEDGALWVTESFGGRIYRIAPENLSTNNSAEIWLEDAALRGPTAGSFGANGITLLGDRLYTVVTDQGTLLSIDPTIEAPTGDDLQPVTLTFNGGEVPLVRPDGITAVPGSQTDILIVENGLGVAGGGKKLLRARIDRR
jgi:sugar lactone lactonase YvrE